MQQSMKFDAEQTQGVLPVFAQNGKPRRKPIICLLLLGLTVIAVVLAVIFIIRSRDSNDADIQDNSTLENGAVAGIEAKESPSAESSTSDDRDDEALEDKALGPKVSLPTGVQLNDIGKRGTGVEYLYEMPSGSPKGVMLLLHGCKHTSLGFWYPSDACPECIGFDAGVRWKDEALSRGYIALAVSSSNTKYNCWLGPDEGLASGEGRDFDNVKVALDTVADVVAASGDADGATNARERVVAYGISSGGKFVSALPIAKNGAGDGVIAIVSNVTPAIDEAIAELGEDYPPIAFIHMSRNSNDIAKIRANLEALKNAGVPAKEWIVEPRPFTVEFCSRKMPRMGRETCQELVSKLKDGGYLNEKNFIKDPPRKSGWQEAAAPIAEKVGDRYILEDLERSTIAHAMNIAWGFHEMTSDFMTSALDFLERQV